MTTSMLATFHVTFMTMLYAEKVTNITIPLNCCRSRNLSYKFYQAVIDVKTLSQNDVELDELFSYLRSIINIFFGCFCFDEFYNLNHAPPSSSQWIFACKGDFLNLLDNQKFFFIMFYLRVLPVKN